MLPHPDIIQAKPVSQAAGPGHHAVLGAVYSDIIAWNRRNSAYLVSDPVLLHKPCPHEIA